MEHFMSNFEKNRETKKLLANREHKKTFGDEHGNKPMFFRGTRERGFNLGGPQHLGVRSICSVICFSNISTHESDNKKRPFQIVN